LHHLCSDPARKEEIVDWASEFCAPRIVDIEFSETDEGDVRLRLVEEGNRKISVLSVSDGTLRFLAYLAALLSMPAGGVLVTEEMENGMHPARVRVLLEKLRYAIGQGDRQVIATTHSGALLSWLPKESLPDAVLMAR